MTSWHVVKEKSCRPAATPQKKSQKRFALRGFARTRWFCIPVFPGSNPPPPSPWLVMPHILADFYRFCRNSIGKPAVGDGAIAQAPCDLHVLW